MNNKLKKNTKIKKNSQQKAQKTLILNRNKVIIIIKIKNSRISTPNQD